MNKKEIKFEVDQVQFIHKQESEFHIQSSIQSHPFGVYAYLHQQPSFSDKRINRTSRIMLHHTITVQAHEYELLSDSGDIVTRIDLKTSDGVENTITLFGVTATQLIEALEAARMANTPEAQLESAQ